MPKDSTASGKEESVCKLERANRSKRLRRYLTTDFSSFPRGGWCRQVLHTMVLLLWLLVGQRRWFRWQGGCIYHIRRISNAPHVERDNRQVGLIHSQLLPYRCVFFGIASGLDTKLLGNSLADTQVSQRQNVGVLEVKL